MSIIFIYQQILVPFPDRDISVFTQHSSTYLHIFQVMKYATVTLGMFQIFFHPASPAYDALVSLLLRSPDPTSPAAVASDSLSMQKFELHRIPLFLFVCEGAYFCDQNKKKF